VRNLRCREPLHHLLHRLRCRRPLHHLLRHLRCRTASLQPAPP